MKKVETQREIRSCRSLPFCYLCGKPRGKTDKDRDHVPPESLFLEEDRRANPLILLTHRCCNKTQSDGDEVLANIFTLIHRPDNPKSTRIQFGTIEGQDGREDLLAFKCAPITPLILRIVRGCHAALYGEPLLDGRAYVYLPFPEGERDADGRTIFKPITGEQIEITNRIKANRKAGRLDRVSCFNAKCIYECFWQSVPGESNALCYFALRLYDWENVGDRDNFPKRGCVGRYSSSQGVPEGASVGTDLYMPVHGDQLDPFS